MTIFKTDLKWFLAMEYKFRLSHSKWCFTMDKQSWYEIGKKCDKCCCVAKELVHWTEIMSHLLIIVHNHKGLWDNIILAQAHKFTFDINKLYMTQQFVLKCKKDCGMNHKSQAKKIKEYFLYIIWLGLYDWNMIDYLQDT